MVAINNYFIVSKSLTSAQRMERCILNSGIICTITRAQGKVAGMGCGYSIRVQEKDFASAIRALRQCGMKPGKVYVGSWEHLEEYHYDIP